MRPLAGRGDAEMKFAVARAKPPRSAICFMPSTWPPSATKLIEVPAGTGLLRRSEPMMLYVLAVPSMS